MKKALPVFLAVALFGTSPALASDIGLDLNLHLGSRSAAPIIVEEAPLFLVPPTLGFQVAVGVPYDMFLIDGRYFLCREKVWFAAPGYGGPWGVIPHDRLPPGLAKRRYTEIIALRDEEYGHYKRDRDHYKGKAYRPGKAEKSGHGRKKHKKHDN
jgi:hypothetical protein